MPSLKSLESYRLLVAKVDAFSDGVAERYADALACRRGCDSCCTHIGISAVEAISLALAVAQLPAGETAQLRERAGQMRDGEACPLLLKNVCLLYAARPIICRTQGLPLLVREEGEARVDHCPLNFQEVDAISGAAVLDLDTLNQALAAINLLCLEELKALGVDLLERMPLAEALCLKPGSLKMENSL